MTDVELVRLAAEKVMHRSASVVRRIVEYIETGDDTGWNPLVSDDDAFQIVDKLAEEGFDFDLHGGWKAQFHCPYGPCKRHGNTRKDWGHGSGEVRHVDRRRAIVLAALKAVGVEVEA